MICVEWTDAHFGVGLTKIYLYSRIMRKKDLHFKSQRLYHFKITSPFARAWSNFP